MAHLKRTADGSQRLQLNVTGLFGPGYLHEENLLTELWKPQRRPLHCTHTHANSGLRFALWLSL